MKHNSPNLSAFVFTSDKPQIKAALGGDPYGIRTRITTVKGWAIPRYVAVCLASCLRLANGFLRLAIWGRFISARSWAQTSNRLFDGGIIAILTAPIWLPGLTFIGAWISNIFRS